MVTEEILRRQDASRDAYDSMLKTMFSYEPCRVLTIADVKFLAEMVRTVTFGAIEDVDKKEGRK